MIRISLSGSEKSIDAIWQWYRQASFVLRNKLAEEEESPSLVKSSVFSIMAKEEVEVFFIELDRMVMLDLLSATEAAIRVDFWVRVHDRKKDLLSRDFRQLAKKHGKKIALDQHILSSWAKWANQKSSIKTSLGNFRGILKLRDWLAHGRYWTPKLGKIYLPRDAFDICDAMLGAMELR